MRLLKRFFITVLVSVLVLTPAMTVCGAFDIVTSSAEAVSVSVKKGKVYNKKGRLYTGWYTLNGHRYYAENGKRIKGWKKISKKYYYFDTDYSLVKNRIVGSASKGYYYVDRSGVRVTSREIRLAVDFVIRNSNPKARQRERLRQCFQALRTYPYVNRGDTPPRASQLPSYANYMFTRKNGDCYYYAVTMSYIARVLGYDSRIAEGGVTAWGPDHPKSPHGWCEVHVNSGWKVIDCSMQNGHPDANLFFVSREAYPYWLRCDRTYVLNSKEGKISWK